MNHDTLLLQASARSNGHTSRVVRHLADQLDCPVVDLLDHRIHPYDYAGNYPADDSFIALVRDRLLPVDRIILASPVYWYAMSGGMKTFLDRFTDLLTTHKELGRQLRGKQLAVLSCANDAEVNLGFYEPFRLTAAYLGMTYTDTWHGYVKPDGTVVVMRRH
ncbi:flavodoxin family protein [Neolewinella maritima]|uniref:flavodoxin family protein n=1 Tax=Neolewinella maritima TaxID=1383882 RepID=UPI001EE9139A|nr:NAD(P)H-dependent oxidoreductase [Neolewinella maritima]